MAKTGHCKLCKSEFAPALNKLVSDDKNAAEAAAAMEQFGLTFTRRTYYEHKKHVTHPLLTAVEDSQKNPVVVPKSNREALESIRDLGMKRALENPDEVTVDHAIKAADMLERQNKGADSIQIVLAKVLMGVPPEGPMLEGEYHELEGGDEDNDSTEAAG